MDPVSKKQSSGVALVFVLMALIALLALAVVFLSRIGREETTAVGQPESATVTTTGTEQLEVLEIPAEEQTTESEAAQTPTPEAVIPPPPPPPVETPDTRNLPPEG